MPVLVVDLGWATLALMVDPANTDDFALMLLDEQDELLVPIIFLPKRALKEFLETYNATR